MPNVGDIIRASDLNGAGNPPGAVVPFYNVTLSGRYPIFWGKSEADTGWLVCDGGSDLHGGTVPNLTNKFIMGTNTVSGAKKTGGSTTTSSTSTSGTVGATTITSSNAGSHQHYVAANFQREQPFVAVTSSNQIAKALNGGTAEVWYSEYVLAGASDEATIGRTSIGIGGSGSHTHSFTGSSHTHTITPPYYTLIYLVKLP